SIVPVGISDYRENLPEMTAFTKESALEVIEQVENAAGLIPTSPFPHITDIVFSRKGKAELAVLLFVAVFVR
ncbi:MAG: DUF512 domain-containing protein, partial [Lentisphaeria bacterium]|nr:DUF512 domain-containing protein [Lentisphaeria bacterium]